MANLTSSTKYLDLEGLSIYDGLIKGVITAGDQANAAALDSLKDTVTSLETSTSDWNENDPTSLSYIKNRTHYEETSERILYTGNEAPIWRDDIGMFFDIPLDPLMQLGEEIEMKFTPRGADGSTVLRGIAEDYKDEGVMVSLKNSSGPSASLYNEYQYEFGPPFNLFIEGINIPQDTDFEIEIKAFNTTVHVLNEKFIPATIARTATTLSGYSITDAKISNGVITLGNNTITPLTQHQDISGKEDKTSIESVATGSVALSADVSKYYTFVDAIETFAITLPSPTDVTKVQTTVFFMTIGANPAITFNCPRPIYYHDGFELEAGKTYEVNALFNGSAWIVTAVEIFVPENIITYEATAKLTETTNEYSIGLHTNAFRGKSGQLTMTSHTFENGVGTIEFNGDVTSIGGSAFSNCRDLTSITIPHSVTSIGNYAFYQCTGLTSVTIPNSVTSIGERAFYECRGLTSITIPNSVTSIGIFAFGYCSGLTNVTIPNSVTSIGNYAFSNCTGLTSTTIGSSVTSIGEGTFFNCSGLTSATIGSGVTNIGNSAFNGCTGLTSITIPNSVTTIGGHAFNDCTNLTSITCNATTAPTIQSNTFQDVKTGGTLTVPSGSSGYDVWMGTGDYYLGKYNWTKVVPPQPITYTASAKLTETTDEYSSGLHTNAFWGKSGKLTITSHTFENGVGTIEFDGDVTYIGKNAFKDCTGLTSVTIPDSVTDIGESAFASCTSLPVVDNIRYADTYAVEAVDKTLTTYTLKEDTRYIGSSAFRGCTSLTSIDIPDSVTSIGNYAFYKCSGMTSVTIGSGVTSIGEWAFASCTGLTSIVMPDSVTTIEDAAFQGCSGLTSIVISNSVTYIDKSAFNSCSSLTSVTIPDSVTSIAKGAFGNCSSLTSIVSNAMKAPTIQDDTFRNVKTGGTLYVPSGSTGYDVWMSSRDDELGKYNWTKVEQ